MLTVALAFTFAAGQAAFGRIPTNVATSIVQMVRLGSWSVQKGSKMLTVDPPSTLLACQEPLVHTIPAFTTSNGLLG